MSTFINIELEKVVNRKYVGIHLLFLFIWVLIGGVFLFRIDLNLVNVLPGNYNWISYTAPMLLIGITYLCLRKLKWYYWLAFIFYIPLLAFWFIPKFILQNGKFYLFVSYFSMIFRRIRRWKSSLIHFLLIFFVSLFLVSAPNDLIRVLAIFFATYFLVKYNYKYTKRSIRPVSFFGNDLKAQLGSSKSSEENKFRALESLISGVKKKNLPAEEVEIKKLTKIANYHTIFDCIKSNLSSTRGKSAFLIYWLMTFIFSISFSILVVAFINYQIYIIDNDSFLMTHEFGFGEFFRYTAKSLTYGDVDGIKPNSGLTKILEGMTFFVIGVLYLMILIGFGFSVRNSKIEEETELIVTYLDNHLQLTDQFVSLKFNKNLSQVIDEIDVIKQSAQKIRLALNRIF